MIMNLRNKMKSQKGFTLVELMVVIAILGILAAIAVPKFANSTNSAKDAALKADLRTVDSALALYYSKNNAYPATADVQTKLVTDYLAAWPKDAKGVVLSYTVGATSGYVLNGTDSAGTTVKSPGSN